MPHIRKLSTKDTFDLLKSNPLKFFDIDKKYDFMLSHRISKMLYEKYTEIFNKLTCKYDYLKSGKLKISDESICKHIDYINYMRNLLPPIRYLIPYDVEFLLKRYNLQFYPMFVELYENMELINQNIDENYNRHGYIFTPEYPEKEITYRKHYKAGYSV